MKRAATAKATTPPAEVSDVFHCCVCGRDDFTCARDINFHFEELQCTYCLFCDVVIAYDPDDRDLIEHKKAHAHLLCRDIATESASCPYLQQESR